MSGPRERKRSRVEAERPSNAAIRGEGQGRWATPEPDQAWPNVTGQGAVDTSAPVLGANVPADLGHHFARVNAAEPRSPSREPSPGEEQSLPHEAPPLVQQAHGRGEPSVQMKGKPTPTAHAELGHHFARVNVLEPEAGSSTGTLSEPLQRQPESAGSLGDSFETGGDVETQIGQSKGRGSPLPDTLRAYMEPRFGTDFSQVRVHTDSDALQMNRAVGAQAFTHGSDIYFGAGSSPTNLGLTAHELTHVVQQRSGVQLDGGVGATGDRYEQHAEQVADAVVRGKSAAPLLDTHAGNSGAAGGVQQAVQRFDAGSGGHQGIERGIAGLDVHEGLGAEKNLTKAEPERDTREQGANAIYSGNYMQDFSQMHAPFVHKLLKNLPQRPVDAAMGKDSPTIGDAGSEAITDSIIRALAILDVGPTLADSVVKGNMQAYEPEQHVDQPQGYAANTDSIVRDNGLPGPLYVGPTGPLRLGKPTVEGGVYASQGNFDFGRCTDVKNVDDADRDRDLAGSAAPGRQMENPELFRVSDAGLQSHIYNSSEWSKNHWLKAAEAGPTDQGRFHIGAGLHVIEDYFSHSNFIEVALNSYIDELLPKKRSKQPEGIQSFLKQVEKDEKATGGVQSQQKLGGKATHVDTLFDETSAESKSPPGGHHRLGVGHRHEGQHRPYPPAQGAAAPGCDRRVHREDLRSGGR